MCDETIDYSPAVLKLIPNWFVTSKMTIKLFTALYTDKNILIYSALMKILVKTYSIVVPISLYVVFY